MASIDDRIVRIQFDNASFERKLAQTVANIQRLNTTIANAGAKSGLDKINIGKLDTRGVGAGIDELGRKISGLSGLASKFHLGGMTSAIDTVSGRFLALGVAAGQILADIALKAGYAGLSIAKSLSLDPVLGGFSEYELQIGSIQTILANTSADGTNLTDVNAALDELNEYSDKTIYNFGEMTRNIGTFTAAGVDLDTSVSAIKGIANLGAISGSNPEQVASGMYQLSQAVSTGTLRLIDWNSVVNAGMGGEVFQKSLFETGKALGTLEGVPIDQTFEEWTAAGNTFRGSLEDGWVTSEVLTTTLGGFTGEMSKAQLVAQGFTESQADEMMRLGQLGVESATKVRTLTGLIQTSKEALESGWASSFELVFGNFEEATELFTGLSDAIGGSIKRSADARNAMLSDWKDMGGRTILIDGLRNAFRALTEIMAPVKAAFREIFPAMTAQRLFDLTVSFRDLMRRMRPSAETVENVKRIFTGFFGALEIGWTIIKEGIKFIAGLVKSLTGLGSGNFLGFLAKIGDFFTKLNTAMVTEGGIAAFFDDLTAKLQRPIEMLGEFKDKIKDLFKGIKVPKGLSDLFDGFGGLFGNIGAAGAGAAGAAGGLWEPFKNALSSVGDILESAWEAISGFFGSLGSKIADIFDVPSLDGIMDILDTALVGGIAAILFKLSKGGLFKDFGGGIFSSISGAFGELTGTLRAMQADLRASALMKIAIAIGILAASLLLLSTIPAEKMSDSLSALAIVFGLLIGAFAALEKLGSGLTSAGTFALIAAGMILMAGAIGLLSLSIKFLSTMSWEELSKGLAGVAGGLGLMVGAVLLLNFAKGGMISAGIGMMFIASAMIIMAGAVKLFSMMDWAEMGQGLLGVAAALLAIGIASKFMGPSLILIGPGLIAVAIALGIISGAMNAMAILSWEDMGKGLVAMGGALAIIAAATHFMSPWLPLVGVGLIAVSIALGTIAGVMKLLGTMSWGEVARGLTVLAGALLAIGLFTTLTSGGILGAAGLVAMAFGLSILVGVLTTMAALSWGEILKGVAGIAIALGALGAAALLLSPAVIPLLGIGLAIALIGAGFALFGVGVLSVAKGLSALLKVGPEAITALVDALITFSEALPEVFRNAGEAVVEFLDEILTGLPEIIDKIVEVLGSILDGLEPLIPKAGKLISTLIREILRVAREYFPDLVRTGLEMITALLTGLRDNIGPITELVAEILINFMDAMAIQIPALIDSFVNLLIAVIEGVIAKAVDLGQRFLPVGSGLLKGILDGIISFLPVLGAWFLGLPGLIIGFIVNAGQWLLEKGGQIITGLKDGAVAAWNAVVAWFKGIPGLIKEAIPAALDVLKTIGKNVINGLYNGGIAAWNKIKGWFKGIPAALKAFFPAAINLLLTIGKNIINGLYNGAIAAWNKIKGWFKGIPNAIKAFFTGAIQLLVTIGKNVINGLYNGAISAWNTVKGWFGRIPQAIRSAVGTMLSTLRDIGRNVVSGLQQGAISAWGIVRGWFGRIPQSIRTAIGGLRSLLSDIGRNAINSLKNGAESAWESVKGFFRNIGAGIKGALSGALGIIGSPSRVLCEIGKQTMQGFGNGMKDEWSNTQGWLERLEPAKALEQYSKDVSAMLARTTEDLNALDEFQPVITPVLDLTQVQYGASQLSGMLPASASFAAAASISKTTAPREETDSTDPNVQGGVHFEQNIYAPKQLSMGDIYKQTRNQIEVAKEELKIP